MLGDRQTRARCLWFIFGIFVTFTLLDFHIIPLHYNLKTYAPSQDIQRGAQSSTQSQLAHAHDSGSSIAVSQHPRQPLSIALPAGQANLDFCHTLLTLNHLGYPTPTILNWNKTFHHDTLLAGGGMIAKIAGIAEYLDSVVSSGDDKGLILLADAFDVWFQLPQDVLLQRYNRLKRHAQEKYQQKPGAHNANFEPQILFAADKGCSPYHLWHPACYLQPESTLAKDTYGLETDKSPFEQGREDFLNYRPRYLNSGFIMGPAGPLRRLFRQALRLQDLSRIGSDQQIFDSIFMVQEYARGMRRYGHTHYDLTEAEKNLGFITPSHLNVVDEEAWAVDLTGDYEGDLFASFDANHDHHGVILAHMLASDNARTGAERNAATLDLDTFEYGVYVDYASAMSFQSSGGSRDSEYLVFNGTSTGLPPAGNAIRNTTYCHTHSRVLAGESLQDVVTNRIEVDRHKWTDLPLLTDMCSGEVPVAIHHNGLKAARTTQWRKTEHELGFWQAPVISSLFSKALDMRHQTQMTDRDGILGHVRVFPDQAPLAVEEICLDYDWSLAL